MVRKFFLRIFQFIAGFFNQPVERSVANVCNIPEPFVGEYLQLIKFLYKTQDVKQVLQSAKRLSEAYVDKQVLFDEMYTRFVGAKFILSPETIDVKFLDNIFTYSEIDKGLRAAQIHPALIEAFVFRMNPLKITIDSLMQKETDLNRDVIRQYLGLDNTSPTVIEWLMILAEIWITGHPNYKNPALITEVPEAVQAAHMEVTDRVDACIAALQERIGKKHLDKEQKAVAIQYIEQHPEMNYKEISVALNLSHQRVCQLAKEANINNRVVKKGQRKGFAKGGRPKKVK